MYAPTGVDVMGELGLREPLCQRAFVKGWHGLVGAGADPVFAAVSAGLTEEEFAVSIGFLKRFRRRLRRGLRRGLRAARGAARSAVRLARKGLKYAWRIVRKFIMRIARPLARVICRVPRWILRRGAQAAGVNPRYISSFCKAVRIRNMNQIRRLLPIAMAIGVKIAAQGAFPPIVPVMRFIKRIPRQIRRLIVRFFPKRVRRYAKIALAGELDGAFFPPTAVAAYRPIDRGISPDAAGWA